MSELVRNLVSKFCGYVVERRFAPRICVRLAFSISVSGKSINRQTVRFTGHTKVSPVPVPGSYRSTVERDVLAHDDRSGNLS